MQQHPICSQFPKTGTMALSHYIYNTITNFYGHIILQLKFILCILQLSAPWIYGMMNVCINEWMNQGSA